MTQDSLAGVTTIGGQPVSSAREVIEAYKKGIRRFFDAKLDGEDLSNLNLTGASFFCGSLRAANLSNSLLTHTQFKGADLTGAKLSGARMNATDLIAANFTNADLYKVDLTGAILADADLSGANLASVWFQGTALARAKLDGVRLTNAILERTYLDDTDVSTFCDTKKLKHEAPSNIDYRTIIRSHRNPRLKRFIVDCGVPEIFAEYMIDCANALDISLKKMLMQSTFISYGTPDESFARKLYKALRAHGVVTFFFPETATIGERISSEVFRNIQEHDRVLLVCSRNSLTRSGVINEIQETLDREARDGGATYLLPITIDDYVFREWRTINPALAESVGRRIIGDFRKSRHSSDAFDRAVSRVVDALKLKRPSDHTRRPASRRRPS